MYSRSKLYRSRERERSARDGLHWCLQKSMPRAKLSDSHLRLLFFFVGTACHTRDTCIFETNCFQKTKFYKFKFSINIVIYSRRVFFLRLIYKLLNF